MSPHTTTPRVTLPWLDYLGITLLIVLPLWLPGYVLTMDTVFTPHLVQSVGTQDMPSMAALLDALSLANQILPSQVVEKLILSSVFLLAGVGTFRLAQGQRPVRYVAGLLAIFNPFVYDHFMYGQWTVLLAYALLPWLLADCLDLAALDQPWWLTARPAVWWSAIAILSLPMGLIAAAATVILMFWTVAAASNRWAVGRRLLWVIFLILLLNSYWLAADLTHPPATLAQVSQFSLGELSAFATRSDPIWGSLLTVVGGYGFWAEDANRFLNLRTAIPIWPLIPLLLAGLAGTGARSLWLTRHYARAGSLVTCTILATFLAIGMAAPLPAALTRFMFMHSALYRGLRDTQKWEALALISMVILAISGLEALVARLRRSYRSVVLGLGFVVPLLWAPALLWGCLNQLHPADYPPSWYAAEAFLQHQAPDARTLFLPWHLYLRLDFAGRVVANPAEGFFTVPMVTSTNMELGVDASAPSSLAGQIATLLATRPTDPASQLARLGIRYVMLAQVADWPRYGWLADRPHLKMVFQQKGMTIWAVANNSTSSQ